MSHVRGCVWGVLWVLLLVLGGLPLAATAQTCVLQSEVIDVLHFSLPEQNLRMMLTHEQSVWTPFLKKQPGFLSKQILVRSVRGSLQVTFLNHWKSQAALEAAKKTIRDKGPASVYPGIVYQGGGDYTVYQCS